MEHAFADNEKAEKQLKTYQRKKEDPEFDFLIDIQKKLAQGKGKYYVCFAKNFNTKQVAKAVFYLKQHDIRSYDDLEKNVKTATARFTELSASIKEKEKRLAEIQVLKKHIFDYFKTKDVYAAYRKCGYSKKFLEEHRQEILLHKAAKNAFEDEFFEVQKRLTLEGNIVISVGLFGHSGDEEVWDGMDEGTLSKTKEMLDDMHKRKIDMADEIFVINVGGYIGESTRSEIDYAIEHGKKVRYLED